MSGLFDDGWHFQQLSYNTVLFVCNPLIQLYMVWGDVLDLAGYLLVRND